ncbi:hypothetical protein [Corynebacterium provencense]|uniref:Uncharacterized protein n=1 Tax=Corynebacterium provencense TaxID=1737425 RepID=A0A2Z3YMV4_9CORY|nr:hypothetical protein [Corynebacterium provencense]AWT25358.1 hypothetical protein Csp1_05400 [Corynebacterium provencense]
MGRLIILILVIVTVVVLWRAFGPGSAARAAKGRDRVGGTEHRQVAGPEDDPDFLWEIRKRRFKEQREKERLAAEELRSAEARARDAERRAAEAEQKARDAEKNTRPRQDETLRDRHDSDGESSGETGRTGA